MLWIVLVVDVRRSDGVILVVMFSEVELVE